VRDAGLDDVLEGLAADGLVERAGGRWRTTRRGWLLGNVVFGRVWNAG
jgi:oxygen-independent coproporphyrinogen-3 oxidase